MSADTSDSQRRMTENEAIFRKHNEKLEKQLTDLSDMAEQDGHSGYGNSDELLLQFYCECCDENCHERVELSVSKYRDIHKNRKRFVIVPGHDVVGLERIVEESERYHAVEKFLDPPEDPTTLHATTIQNV